MSKAAGRSKKKGTLGAGFAGAGSGTGLLLYVANIPSTNPYKPLLTLVAPTVSVIVSAVWLFIMDHFDIWLADRTISSELKKAEATLATIEADPKSTAKLKADARKAVEGLRLTQLGIHERRIEAVIET